MKTIRLGCGAGYSGDRIEPAVELVCHGRLNYLVFECLAERTIALAQAARARDPGGGYDALLEERLRAVLPACCDAGTRIVTNMGAANPDAAARLAARVARDLGYRGLRIAAVAGDDVIDLVRAGDFAFLDGNGSTAMLGDRLVSANAYLGCEGIVMALAQGADIVITGRVGDPALFLGPLVHSFGWRPDDWTLLGRGTLIGHLLECAGQLTGGYFADPGISDIPDLARLGFPFAEVSADGSAVFGKIAGSGGRLTLATCKEQLLYEVLDPSAYLQADVSADFTSARLRELAPNRIALSGGGGSARPNTLKVSVGYRDGFIGEGQISYAGPGALARARLALEIVRDRLTVAGIGIGEMRTDLIGYDSIMVTDPADRPEPCEVRARVAARAPSAAVAARVGREVEALYTNGPTGGGGAACWTREITAIGSILIDRSMATPRVSLEVS